MVEIAVVDTGVSLNYFDNVTALKSSKNFSDINKMSNDEIPNNIITHGTICASIIKNYAPSAPLHSLNVFENGICKLESVVAAMKYCLELNIKIVNISFGVNYIDNDDILKDIVNIAVEKGIIIIAAVSKNGIVTYPAYYDGVISVGVQNELKLRKNKIRTNKNPLSTVDVFACGIQRLYKNMHLRHITTNEPSYATAVVSALVYNMLCNSRQEATNKRVIEMLSQQIELQG